MKLMIYWQPKRLITDGIKLQLCSVRQCLQFQTILKIEL